MALNCAFDNAQSDYLEGQRAERAARIDADMLRIQGEFVHGFDALVAAAPGDAQSVLHALRLGFIEGRCYITWKEIPTSYSSKEASRTPAMAQVYTY